MAEELKDLIEKIHEEGVRAAEDKAKEIEADAKRRAEAIIKKATQEAENLIKQARDTIARDQQGTRALLKQAGRDMLLALRKEIVATLEGLIKLRVRKALSPAEIAKILKALVADSIAKGKDEIVISLKSEDLEKLEKGFLAELKQQARNGITLKSRDDITAGFIISYDAGKSHFDFTDKALAEYISSQVKPALAEILK